MKAKFYMKSGNIIQTDNVEKLSTKLASDGSISEYSITWNNRPNKLFTISLPEIEAIIVED